MLTQCERLLILDAACCAAECCSDPEIREAIGNLQEKLDFHFESCVDFHVTEEMQERFIENQINAVNKFADYPESFC